MILALILFASNANTPKEYMMSSEFLARTQVVFPSLHQYLVSH